MSILRYFLALFGLVARKPRPAIPPNALRRVKKYFELESTSIARRMIEAQDLRILTLPDDTLDALGLKRRKPLTIPGVTRAWHYLVGCPYGLLFADNRTAATNTLACACGRRVDVIADLTKRGLYAPRKATGGGV